MLPNHEAFARVQLTTALGQDGVEILTGRRVVRLGRNGDAYVVTTSDDGAAEADRVLVAVGRKAPTDDIGLERVGLNPGGFLEVDEHMRVRGVSWLYAAGDINGRAQFTHMGKYQARIAVDHILGDETAVAHGADGAQAPHVIFTDPQVVSVGHTTESATAAGIDFDGLRHRDFRQPRRPLLRSQRPGDGALPRPPRAARADRLHDHRVRGGRLPARGHDRCGRRGAARAPAPRGAALPDTQRAVAVTARTGRRLTRVSGPSRPAWRVRTDDQALLRRHRTGDRHARSTLIERYLPLARGLAVRYRGSPEELDDLIQVASLGLVKAVDRWDPDRGVAFTSFATPTILGELRHHLRDSSWCVRPPRRLQDLPPAHHHRATT